MRTSAGKRSSIADIIGIKNMQVGGRAVPQVTLMKNGDDVGSEPLPGERIIQLARAGDEAGLARLIAEGADVDGPIDKPVDHVRLRM